MLRRLLPWVAVLALVAAAVGTAGWGRGSGPPAPRSHVSSTPTPSSRPASLSAGLARTLVRGATLAAADLPDGYRPVLRRDPDRSLGALELCGRVMPGQTARLALAAVSYSSAAGSVRQQVVAYRHGVVDAVVDRLRKVAPGCTRPVGPTQVELPATMALWVRGRDRVRRTTVQVVALRRGDLLTVISVDDRDRRLALRLALVVGRRLLSSRSDGEAASASTLGPPDWVRSVE